MAAGAPLGIRLRLSEEHHDLKTHRAFSALLRAAATKLDTPATRRRPNTPATDHRVLGRELAI